MKVLVIGGTRFIGRELVRQLHAAGHAVTVFHRGTTPSGQPDGVGEIRGDKADLAAFREEFSRLAPDVVVDMIQFTEADAHRLLETFRGIAPRVVVASSIDATRAYDRVRQTDPGPPDPVPLDEESPVRDRRYPYRGEEPRRDDDPERWKDDYDKVLVERVVLADPDLPSTVVRLPAVFGPHDYQHRFYAYIKRMLDRRPAILLEEGLATWRFGYGYVENVAHGLALAATATDRRADRRLFHVGETGAWTTREVVERLARALGWRGEIVTAPTGRLPEALRSGLDFRQDMNVASGRIREELGYREIVAPDEAFRRTVEWEAANPPAEPDPALVDYGAEDRVLSSL